MALTLEFPVISSNLKIGYGVFGTADPYNAALPNNGALNPVGSLYFLPAASMGSLALSATAGYAGGLWCKYVLYKSTANPAMQTGPAPVVYTADVTTNVSSFGVVSGQFASTAEGYLGSLSSSSAGWLLPNTGSVAGVGVGTAISATIINNGGLGSYVWIGIQGFIPSAYLSAGSMGQRVYHSGNFATTGVTIDGASTYSDFNFIGTVMAVSSNIANVLATGPLL